MCGKSKAEEFIVRGFGLQTQMYLDGKLIDTRIGAPTDIKKVPNAITAGSLWIDTNLLDIPYIKEGEEFRVVYNGTIGASFIPFSQN